MSSEQPREKEILNTVLKPLLEDFQYWFERACSLLESEQLSFFSAEEQAELLAKVKKTQQEVNTAQMLFKATDGEAGIESRMLVPWHQLVAECWDVARKHRESKNINHQSSDI